MRKTFGRHVATKKMTVAECMKQVTGFEGWKPGIEDRAGVSASCRLSIESPLIYPTMCALTRISNRIDVRNVLEWSSSPGKSYTFWSTHSELDSINCSNDDEDGYIGFRVSGYSDEFRQHMVDHLLMMQCSFDEARKMAHHYRFSSDEMTTSLEHLVRNTAFWESQLYPKHYRVLGR